MANTIATVAQSDVAKPAENPNAVKSATSDQKPTPSQAQPTSTVTDTVSISGAAKAALQEAVETAAQTSKEALGGDRQAQRLLASEAAAKKLLR